MNNMKERWNVKKADGKVYGPVDTGTMREWIQGDRVAPEDYLSPEGTENWQSAKSLPQFADLFSQKTATAAKTVPTDKRRCPGCDKIYPEFIVICVDCGINLITGRPLSPELRVAASLSTSASTRKTFSWKLITGIAISLLMLIGGYLFLKSGVTTSTLSKVKKEMSKATEADKTSVGKKLVKRQKPKIVKSKVTKQKPVFALNAKLFEAIKSEDIHKIRELIDKGADVNAKDQYKQSALWCALMNPFSRKFNLDHKTKEAQESFRKSKEITMLLIEKGADVNVKETEWKKTVLHNAASFGWKDIVKAAIDKGADINARIRWTGETPLHYAFFNAGSADDNARLKTVKLLIDNGADPNIKTKEGETPIKMAECYGMKACANYMRKYGKKGPVVQVAKTEYRFLTGAARANRLDAIKYLLQKGVDINQAGDDGTALHIALAKKYTDIAKFLIENGADINAKNKDGATPLLIAQSRDLMDIMKLLINKGADINVKDPWYRSTPLHHAVSKGDKEMVELLLSKGAETKVKTKHGGTPFEFAMDRYDRDIIKLLIKSGADVNAEVRVGFPLLVALNKEDPEMAKLLISRGANVNITSNSDNSKITPLHLAVTGGYKDLVQLMLEKGADVNAKDSAGRNAMGWARSAKPPKVQNEIMALLRKHGAKR